MAATPPIEDHRTFACTPEQVGLARGWVAAALEAAGFGADAVGAVRLAVSEAVTNIVTHAGGAAAAGAAADACIEATLHIDADGLRLTLRDYGACFDLSGYTPPDLDAMAPGGYGIMLMHTLMDRVEYTPLPDGTRLTMWKRR